MRDMDTELLEEAYGKILVKESDDFKIDYNDESLAEDAERYLDSKGIDLVSHSYSTIIRQAIYHGFKPKQKISEAFYKPHIEQALRDAQKYIESGQGVPNEVVDVIKQDSLAYQSYRKMQNVYER